MSMSIALPLDGISAVQAGNAVPGQSATAADAVAVPEADHDGHAVPARYRLGQKGA